MVDSPTEENDKDKEKGKAGSIVGGPPANPAAGGKDGLSKTQQKKINTAARNAKKKDLEGGNNDGDGEGVTTKTMLTGVFTPKKTKSTLEKTGTNWFPIIFQATGISPTGLAGSLAENSWDKFYYRYISEAPNFVLTSTKNRYLSKAQLIAYEQTIAQIMSLGFVINIFRSLGDYVETGGYKEYSNLYNPISLVISTNMRVNSRAVTLALENLELQLTQFYFNPEITPLIIEKLAPKYIGVGHRKQLLLPSIEIGDFRKDRRANYVENEDLPGELNFVVFPTDPSFQSGTDRANGELLSLLNGCTNYLNKLSEMPDIEDIHTIFKAIVPHNTLNKVGSMFSVDSIDAQGVRANTNSYRNLESIGSVAEPDASYGLRVDSTMIGKNDLPPISTLYIRASVLNGLYGPSYVPISKVVIDDDAIGSRFFQVNRVYDTSPVITLESCNLDAKNLLLSYLCFEIEKESERTEGLFISKGRNQVTEPGIFFHAPVSSGECTVLGTTTNSFSDETCVKFSRSGSINKYNSINSLAGAKITCITPVSDELLKVITDRTATRAYLKNMITKKVFVSRSDTDYFDCNYNSLINQHLLPLVIEIYKNKALEEAFSTYMSTSTRVKIEIIEGLKAFNDLRNKEMD
jgi:hypothetical protein